MVIEPDLNRSERTAIQKLGEFLIRYGLVIVLGWMYNFLSLQATSNFIGVVELSAALLIAIRPLSARLSAIGSVLAVLTFLTTLTFLFSLPGWEKSLGGFPALSGSGGFLLKDIVLL